MRPSSIPTDQVTTITIRIPNTRLTLLRESCHSSKVSIAIASAMVSALITSVILLVNDMTRLHARLLFETIADAVFGQDIRRVGRIRLDLAAQLADIHARIV